ncbi:coiled-coil domain-containing protein 42 like-2-like [Pecten maximus]|uniref:coiled-coil domain-containing protein 42 like-2-like n=1 Tax=Pecten maximus TaxID=6579 RepID=UPI001458BF30|nr:coiled-coil domain-containing protein 42 like-2-like [Pecten maximus]
MADTGGYNLDLDNQKRNVFVTQLNERDDEDEITAFPVVKESGDKLIETGINTLQRTLLLKKQVEVEAVDMELYEKRQEFKRKMEQCAQRQIDIQKRQQQMKDEFTNCEKYIKDYEAKRRRAIQKYQTELKLKDQKTKELEMLQQQMEDLKRRQKHLERSVTRYKKFSDFLMRVIDIMPEDYIPTTDDKVKGLMMRHRTLSESSKALIDKLESAGDEMKELRHELDEIKGEHTNMKMSINGQLARLQHDHEHKEESNKQSEQHFAANKGNMRSKRTEFGVIMMAIDNIAEKCLKALDPTVEGLSLEQKLKKIGDHVVEREDVARIAMPTDSTTHKESSRGNSADLQKSKAKKKVQVLVSSPS